MFVVHDDSTGEQTRDLLALHLTGMRVSSAPGSVFALDLSGLHVPEVTLWWASTNEGIAAVGVLTMLPDRIGEVKSMRTHPDFLRKGAATAVFERIISAAQLRGAGRLSLETGSGPLSDPALALYRRHGFRGGAPFSTYQSTGFNQFPHLDMTPARRGLPL